MHSYAFHSSRGSGGAYGRGPGDRLNQSRMAFAAGYDGSSPFGSTGSVLTASGAAGGTGAASAAASSASLADLSSAAVRGSGMGDARPASWNALTAVIKQ